MTFREGGFCPVKKQFSNSQRAMIVAFHCLLLGPVLRYVYILYCGYVEFIHQGKKRIEGPYCVHPTKHSLTETGLKFYSMRKYYERDSAYLGLIEAFIQDGPQLVLQLYILAVRHHDDLSDPYIGDRLGRFLFRKNSLHT